MYYSSSSSTINSMYICIYMYNGNISILQCNDLEVPEVQEAAREPEGKGDLK